jgi:CubicO group peptidase (beta-lactamase class C family)
MASGLVSAALPILVGLPIPLVGSVCRLGALLTGGLVASGASGDALRSNGAGKDHGMSAADVQARVQALIDHRVASGDEVGVQVAVVEHGRVVVDAVSGSADSSQSETVGSDTLFWAASTAKGVALAVAHVLVERGEPAYDLRAADVWPEFGAHGKDRVTLRHVLLHTAGVPAPPYDTTVEQLCDWDHMCTVLAEAKPWWEPGSRFGYHAKTFGFLLGEIVRRATGRTLSWWLREVVTVPLGIGDEVHSGCPRSCWTGLPASSHRSDRHPRHPLGGHHDRPRGGPDLYRAARRRRWRRPGLTGTAGQHGGGAVRGPGRGHGYPVEVGVRLQPATAGGVPSRPGSMFGMVGMNGSAAYADIDSGVADVCPPGCSQPDLRRKE